jgi:hypothetical protein
MEEKYEIYIKKTNKRTNAGERWHSMLMRCTSEKLKNRFPSYADCSVCEEWKDFQIFAKWHEENYYKIDNEKMCLDKDILIKGNKIYSPNTCVFTPQKINLLFTNRKLDRGNYPVGVSRDDSSFASKISIKGKDICIGRYSTKEEAFQRYKEEKEKYIKQVADEYKNRIPKKLHEAMYNYKIEITD